MRLSELISRYGDDDVVFQRVDDCAVSLTNTKHGSKASFVTPEPFGLEGFHKLGLIVWMDRSRAAAVIADAKAAAGSRQDGDEGGAR